MGLITYIPGSTDTGYLVSKDSGIAPVAATSVPKKVAVYFDNGNGGRELESPMSAAIQLKLLKEPRKDTKLWWIRKQQVYGGSLNYRKVARPFDSKKLSHTVLKADLAPNLAFYRFQKTIHEIIHRLAKRYGIKIQELAIQPDHVHVLSFTKSREAQVRFLRFVTAEIGRWYARLRRRLGYSARRLWRARPFTRLVGWGRKNLQTVRHYIQRNRAETLGFVAYKPRNHRLNVFLARWAGPLEALSPPVKKL